MAKRKYFRELIDKYKENTLSESEFQELLHMLNDSGNERALEDALTDYWHEMSAEVRDEKSKVPSSRPQKGNRQLMHWGIAASFLILITATTIFYLLYLPYGESFTTYATEFAEIEEIELSDGSRVTLNANSELTWDNHWEDSGVRTAVLTGEAFFDIRHLRDGMSFFVRSGDVSVEVVGTSFNIDCRDQKVEVYLDEGEIHLFTEGRSVDKIKMEPGEKVKYDPGRKKIERTTNESMISAAAWKKGVLNFKDMEFRLVLDKLKNIYGKSFQCDDDELLSKTIYLGVPYSDWDAVMQALELSLDIRFMESNGKIKITSSKDA